MRLFDDTKRNDYKPADYLTEPKFAFLNNAAGACWEAVRNELESWFARFPAEGQLHLCTRFRSDRDEQHLAAFWELYLHEVFSRLGFTVHIHPKKSGKSPDFLLERGGESFYLEAVTVAEPPGEMHASRFRGQIVDEIDARVRSDQFMVAFNPLRQGARTPPLAKVAKDLQAWLDELSLEDVLVTGILSRWQQWPTRIQSYQDWILEFHAMPRFGQRARGRVVVSHGPSEMILVTDWKAIRKEIRDKASRYGELDKPYVVGLLCNRWTARDYAIAQALLGTAWEHPEMLRSGKLLDPFQTPEDEGAWLRKSGPAMTRVSAVLSALKLTPTSLNIAHVEPRLWHNPWAQYPLRSELPFGAVRVEAKTGELQSFDPVVPVWQILGLSHSWPPGECFQVPAPELSD